MKRSSLLATSAALLPILILGSILSLGCGKKVRTDTFGPNEYFEYAKKEFDQGKYLKAITDFTIIVFRW